MRKLLLGSAVLFLAIPAWADRPLTDVERAKLVPALTAQGCAGGKMEFDDGQFEVDDAQ